MRKPIIAANWKMNIGPKEAEDFISTFAFSDGLGRRDAEEGHTYRACGGDDLDCDQSWRRDTIGFSPAALESHPHLLCSLLRDHLGGGHG